MPLETPVGVEVLRYLVGGEGGVEPRLQSLVSEDGRHAVVDAAEGRVGVNCDHRVREERLLLVKEGETETVFEAGLYIPDSRKFSSGAKVGIFRSFFSSTYEFSVRPVAVPMFGCFRHVKGCSQDTFVSADAKIKTVKISSKGVLAILQNLHL